MKTFWRSIAIFVLGGILGTGFGGLLYAARYNSAARDSQRRLRI